ncbi:MAG TPA: STAS domain-containing protein [Rudaea sp.]|uniref:STAS domain-containing protein n=1 Tax=Rudaea sp. TaxID=2136325 RepID=UPI002F940B62
MSDGFALTANAQGAFAVSGAISFGNAAQALRAAPQGDATGKTIDLDLAGLADSDSATLAVLIAWAAQAHARGATLAYRHAPPALANLARLCDVERLLGLEAA